MAAMRAQIEAAERRLDGLHEELKESLVRRFQDGEKLTSQRAIDADLRYQQRFDAQTKALDAALAAQKEAVHTAMIAAEKATSKAEVAADKRFDSVNEFRQTLSDQAASLMPRSECETRLSSIIDKIDDLKASQHASMGRASAEPTIETRLTEVLAEVARLRDTQSTVTGKSQGLTSGWGYLLGAVSLVVIIVNVFIAVVSR